MAKVKIEIEIDYDENDAEINGPFTPKSLGVDIWEHYLNSDASLFGSYPSYKITVGETVLEYNKDNDYGIGQF